MCATELRDDDASRRLIILEGKQVRHLLRLHVESEGSDIYLRQIATAFWTQKIVPTARFGACLRPLTGVKLAHGFDPFDCCIHFPNNSQSFYTNPRIVFNRAIPPPTVVPGLLTRHRGLIANGIDQPDTCNCGQKYTRPTD
jgi:hypothetical protein